MQPKVEFLSQSLIKRILKESYEILTKIGVSIHNKVLLDILNDFGLEIDFEKKHVKFKIDAIDKALTSVPREFNLYDQNLKQTHQISGNKIHFTPGSSAINILDYHTDNFRKPKTSDYVNYVKVIEQLPYIDSQSTAFIPSDIPEKMSDSY